MLPLSISSLISPVDALMSVGASTSLDREEGMKNMKRRNSQGVLRDYMYIRGKGKTNLQDIT